MERWATFDCYGTLVDWNAGIAAALGDESLVERYHEIEPRVQAEDPGMRYRDVLRETARRLGVDADPAALLPDWPVSSGWFPVTASHSRPFKRSRMDVWSRKLRIDSG